MTRHGRLYRRRRGVYAVGHLAPIELARETEALLAVPSGAVLSHLAAAALWELLPPLRSDDPIDVTMPNGWQLRQQGIRSHRCALLLPRDIRTHKGLPVTSPAWTVLDIAEELTPREVERALEEGLACDRLRLPQVKDIVDRAPGRHGARILTSLLDARTGSTRSRSATEERALALIRQAGLPPPDMNAPLLGYTADFLWRRHRVVLEVDGYPYHSTKTAFERDRRKDAAFRAASLDVIRASADQVWDEPIGVVALVVRTLSLAKARLSEGRAAAS